MQDSRGMIADTQEIKALRARVAELENFIASHAPEGRNITNGQWVDLCTKNRDLGNRVAELEAALKLALEEFEPEDCCHCTIYDSCPNTEAREPVVDCLQWMFDYFLQQAKAGVAHE